MDSRANPHLIVKHNTMTNIEILQADILDLLFENRNKDYGAYALRRGYHSRMLTALVIGLSVILVFAVISSTRAKHLSNKESKPVESRKEGIVIKTIEMPREKTKEPIKPKEIIRQKPVQRTATVNFSTPPEIKKDKDVKNAMVAVKELDGKEISTKTTDGKEADMTVVINKEPVLETGNSIINSSGPSQPAFVIEEKDPQFPGGPEALKQFLARNLQTPEDLENGEKKVVRIKFKVDKDGAVNNFEIVTSGGNELDMEVVRVCKKMPRWSPAIQNGMNVPINYVLPVTFIGAEQ
jgi:protein TonB